MLASPLYTREREENEGKAKAYHSERESLMIHSSRNPEVSGKPDVEYVQKREANAQRTQAYHSRRESLMRSSSRDLEVSGKPDAVFHVKVIRIWTRFPKETEVTNRETASRVVFILFFEICWPCKCWEITSRHTQALWFTIHVLHCKVPRQSGGSAQIPSPTGSEPKAIENEAIEPEDLRAQKNWARQESWDRSVSKTGKILWEIATKIFAEDMDEFGKVDAEMSYIQPQMHSDYDSAERIADSDLEDGELRKMLASPLSMQDRGGCKSSRTPIASGKPAALIHMRGASAKRTQADHSRRESLTSSSSQEPGNLIKSCVFKHADPSNLGSLFLREQRSFA